MEDRDNARDIPTVSMSPPQLPLSSAATPSCPAPESSSPLSTTSSTAPSRRQRILGNILSPASCETRPLNPRQLSPARPSSRRSRSPSFVTGPDAIPTPPSSTVTAAADSAADITPTSSRRRRNAIDSTNPRINPFCDPRNLPAVQPATPDLPRSAIIAAQTGPARFRADPRRLDKPPFQQPFNAHGPAKNQQPTEPPQLQLPYGADFSNYSTSAAPLSSTSSSSDTVAFPEYDESLINADLSFTTAAPNLIDDANPRSSPPIPHDTLSVFPLPSRSRSRHSSPAPPPQTSVTGSPSSTPPRRPRAGTRDAGSPYRTLPPLERPRFG